MSRQTCPMLKPEARIITTICSLKLASKTLRFDFDTFITHVFYTYLCVESHWIRIAIAPVQVQEYLDIRGHTAKVLSNREKALLSLIFNKAREGATRSSRSHAKGFKASRKRGPPDTSQTLSSTKLRHTPISQQSIRWTWRYSMANVQPTC